ncbi:MAG: baseplate J/gp47 family protein [bacterium]
MRGIRKPEPVITVSRQSAALTSVFVGITVIIFAGLLLSGTREAEITVTPSQKDFSFDWSAVISQEEQTGANIVKGQPLSTTVTSSYTGTPTATSSEQAKANGLVTLYNQTSQSQTLVKTTRLLSPDNILFRLDKQVTVPAKGSVSTNVTADQPGATGNITATSFTIPGLPTALQKVIYAKSEVSMTGGDLTVSVVNADDIKKAEEALGENLKNQAMDSLRSLIIPPNTVNQASLAISQPKFASTAKPGDKVGTFTVSGTAVVTAVAYDPAVVKQLAVTKATEGLSPGYSVETESVALNVSKATLSKDNKNATVSYKVTGQLAFDPYASNIDWSVLEGKTVTESISYLKSFPSIGAVTIKVKPAWASSLPNKDKIKVKMME